MAHHVHEATPSIGGLSQLFEVYVPRRQCMNFEATSSGCTSSPTS